MRKIEFRGKTKDNMWLYGNLQVPKPPFDDFFMWDENLYQIQVDPTTIGQYTGLKDKNGKEIYEWDIVKCLDPDGEDDYLSLVRYDGGAFTIDVHFCDYDYTAIGWALDGHIDDIEIIGNIHDNPELLKGSE